MMKHLIPLLLTGMIGCGSNGEEEATCPMHDVDCLAKRQPSPPPDISYGPPSDTPSEPPTSVSPVPTPPAAIPPQEEIAPEEVVTPTVTPTATPTATVTATPTATPTVVPTVTPTVVPTPHVCYSRKGKVIRCHKEAHHGHRHSHQDSCKSKK